MLELNDTMSKIMEAKCSDQRSLSQPTPKRRNNTRSSNNNRSNNNNKTRSSGKRRGKKKKKKKKKKDASSGSEISSYHPSESESASSQTQL